MRLFLLIILLTLTGVIGYSQNSSISEIPNNKIKIYLDCTDCNSIFFRKNLPFVDFVRDPKLADLHIFVTKQKTASNSTEYGLNFIGINENSDIQYKLKTISPQDETDILKWERLLKIIDFGLLPYLSRTPEMARIFIKHDMDKTSVLQETSDPWNYWVIRLGLGTEFEGEESQKEYSVNNSIRADRITDILKFRSEVSYDFSKEIYNDDDEKIESKREEAEFNARLIYSLNSRWSIGMFGEISTSSYLNLNVASSTGPAIEYNIFPWDKSDRKVFTIAYHLKSNYYEYNELTIYDTFKEWRTSESLAVSLVLRQPWGEIENTLEASHYFYDFSKNRLSLESDASILIAKGFSLFMQLETEFIHDQLYLPAGETTREEILLKQKKLATNFEISTELGLRFTFGSVYNNIINQRL
ncbi:hypothetical protein [uncultured Draconibacterium sp.]|uniref:hypothetical protein n=1 Tax=uncultured Draconibacterium sp. TaxID=1573823 RepID=UPI0032167E7D